MFGWEKPPLDVPRALSLCIINHLSVPHVTFVLQMNVDKLKKMAGAVRTGGKGSMRRFSLHMCFSVGDYYEIVTWDGNELQNM